MVEVTDFRLAAAVLPAWLVVVVGLAQPAPRVAGFAIAALASALLCTAMHRSGRRPSRWWLSLGFSLCVCAIVAAALSVRLARVHGGPLATLAAERVTTTATVVLRGDPTLLSRSGRAGQAQIAVDATVKSVGLGASARSISGRVVIFASADGWQELLPGQRVRVLGRLNPPRGGDLTAATVTARGRPQILGRPPWWQGAAGSVRAGLRRASAGLPALPRGLLPGLVDGDTSQLDPVLHERFRVAGLTHLVAVSGTNLSIVIGCVSLALRRARASPRTIAVLGGLAVVAFVVLARPSPSVVRAAAMALLALGGLATGRQRAALPILAATVLAVLLAKPDLSANLGFVLSVAATTGLLLIAPGWSASLARMGLPVIASDAVAVAAAAHLVTAPIIVAISGQLSVVAILANVLAEPVVAVTTVVGLLAALCSVIWLAPAVVLAQLAGWPCRWLVWVAEHCGSLPGAALPWPTGAPGAVGLIAVSAALLAIGRRSLGRLLMCIALGAALVIQVPVRGLISGWPPPGWLMVACDVGQGDAIVLNAGSGAGIVIDVGPEPLAVDRCLRDLHVERIDLLVLTHFHIDHVGGLSGALHRRTIGEVVVSSLGEPAAAAAGVTGLLAEHGLVAHTAALDRHLVVGRVGIDVLGPVTTLSGSRSDPNNASVMLMAQLGGLRILLAGDAEVEAQDAVLAHGADVRADVLKVPHHGSAYSDPAFLRAVGARIAVISVGQGNDYGHPAPSLLAELSREGIPVRRTDIDGDIALTARGRELVPVVRAHRADSSAGQLRAAADRPLARATGVAPAWGTRRSSMRVWPGARRDRPGSGPADIGRRRRGVSDQSGDRGRSRRRIDRRPGNRSHRAGVRDSGQHAGAAGPESVAIRGPPVGCAPFGAGPQGRTGRDRHSHADQPGRGHHGGRSTPGRGEG